MLLKISLIALICLVLSEAEGRDSKMPKCAKKSIECRNKVKCGEEIKTYTEGLLQVFKTWSKHHEKACTLLNFKDDYDQIVECMNNITAVKSENTKEESGLKRCCSKIFDLNVKMGKASSEVILKAAVKTDDKDGKLTDEIKRSSKDYVYFGLSYVFMTCLSNILDAEDAFREL